MAKIATKKNNFTLGKTHNFFFPHAIRKKGVDVAHCSSKKYAHKIKRLLEQAEKHA